MFGKSLKSESFIVVLASAATFAYYSNCFRKKIYTEKYSDDKVCLKFLFWKGEFYRQSTQKTKGNILALVAPQRKQQFSINKVHVLALILHEILFLFFLPLNVNLIFTFM